MPGVRSAVKAVVVDGDKFLIVKQKVGEAVFWDLPGGKVEYGESPLDALHREVLEETTMEVDVVKPIGTWWFYRITKDMDQVVCSTFICKPKNNKVDLSKNVKTENLVEYKWVSKNEFLKGDYPVGHASLKDLIRSAFQPNDY